MTKMRRTIRAVVIVAVLAASLGLLPYVGLPYEPLPATAARLSSQLYARPKMWLPVIMRHR